MHLQKRILPPTLFSEQRLWGKASIWESKAYETEVLLVLGTHSLQGTPAFKREFLDIVLIFTFQSLVVSFFVLIVKITH